MAHEDPDRAPLDRDRGPPPPETPSGARPSAGPTDDPAVVRARREQEQRVRRARQVRVAKVLVALAVVVVLIVFVIANSQGVEVDFVFASRHPPLIWVMLGCALLGGIVGYVVGRPGKELRRLRGRRGRDESKR